MLSHRLSAMCWGSVWRKLAACATYLAPGTAFSHSFSVPYVLPIPFWIYVYGCAATLVVTFAVLGVFASKPAQSSPASQDPQGDTAGLLRVTPIWGAALRVVAVFCLLLSIVSGFIGNEDPARNINLPLFWMVFLLGCAYLTVFVGDVYSFMNPWAAILGWLEVAGIDLSRMRLAYPEWLGYWPAFVLYLALVWVELFLEPTPRTLSNALIVYSMITLIGVGLFGRTRWFSQADLFSNYFRLIGKIAPVKYLAVPGEDVQVRLRTPLAGLQSDAPESAGLVLLVLSMLSSTAYDAIYDTQYWTAFFWENVLWALQPLWGDDLAKAQGLLMNSFLVYRKVGLLFFPFLYLGVYLLALWAAKLLTRTQLSLRALGAAFCYSLIPIAFAYNFAHYYTFLVSQIDILPWLLADPFGWDWNLFGLAPRPQDGTLAMGLIWHTQVIVILIGHVVSVALAHKVAVRVFLTRREIVLSQLPLLLLMVGYTMAGLWILTLPLA